MRTPRQMYWTCMLEFLAKISSTKSVSNLILAVEVRCHKHDGSFYGYAVETCKNKQFSSPNAVFTAFLKRDSRSDFCCGVQSRGAVVTPLCVIHVYIMLLSMCSSNATNH